MNDPLPGLEDYVLPKAERLIYFLYQDDEIIYIGRTKTMESRMICHKKDKKFNRVRFMRMSDSHTEHQKLMWRFGTREHWLDNKWGYLEIALIKTYKPRANNQRLKHTEMHHHEAEALRSEGGLVTQSQCNPSPDNRVPVPAS